MTSVTPGPSCAHRSFEHTACNGYSPLIPRELPTPPLQPRATLPLRRPSGEGSRSSGRDPAKDAPRRPLSRRAACSAPPPPLAPSAKRSGLVHTSTTGTRTCPVPSQRYIVCTRLARLKRMKRGVITSARLHQQSMPSGWKACMVTLTYAPASLWAADQISAFLRHARQWLKRRSVAFRYVWVHESTKSGLPHYHVVFWLPKRVRLPKPDRAGWWPWGLTRIELARNSVGYLAKYASKGDSDTPPPKGARIHGQGGLPEAARLERAWWLSPAYIRDRCLPADRPQRAPGGGWLLKASGEWFPAAYRLVSFGAGYVEIEAIQ